MDRKPHRKQNPEFFEPLKIFFAILLVSLVFFAPIVRSEKAETPTALQEYPDLNPFASSADACPWNCIKCTSWDENAWPRTCLTYECTDASGNCGDPGDGGGGGPSYQPPTISHVLTCSNTGTNGWCIGTLSLDLTASDPQGQSVVISGTVNGTIFTCLSAQTTCSIQLPEALGTATYKVDSATGLSANGSTSYHLDVTTPQISGDINGSSGTNGWYTSQTSVTASASDALSGLASLEVNVDNAGWASYSVTTFTDGIHTIQFRATDNAGNITETAQQSVNVDTTAPALNLSTTGTTGQNGWYISAVTLTPTANDATSGLYSLEATTDGVSWFSVSDPVTLTDGIYTVQFRAIDRAGNVSQTAVQQIKVDATTPNLSLDINGTRGQNDWYISSVIVTPNASDVGSGINKVEASINNGAWSIITSLLSFTDGVHSYKIRTTDNAGNFTETPILPMMVDTVPPAIAIYDGSLNLGDTLMYDIEDPSTGSGQASGLWINRSVIEDEDEKYKKIVWLEEITGKKSNDNEIRWDGIFADGTKAAPGQYFITLKISDQAGNETMRTAIVEVTAFNSILPIPAFTPPVSTVTEPIPSESSATNEQSFGGANNGTVGTETTTSSGESVFASVNLQAGGTNSFSSGNQTTNLPNTNPNILWGAAAAAMLGATLAEWQKKREEEAVRLAALLASNSGQGDEDEIPPDVLAKRRGKVIAKNQAKRAQEQAWEAVRTQQLAQQQAKIAKVLQADMTEDEKLAVYKQTPEYVARQESLKEYERQKALEAQRADERNAVAIVDAYKAQEQAKQNAGGGKPLAVPARQDPNPPEEKTFWEKVKDFWHKIWNPERPIAPTVAPFWLTPSPTVTPMLLYTATPQVTATPQPTSTYLEDQLMAYGIKDLKNINSDLLPTILQATQLTANKFQPFTGGTVQQAFVMSHGTIAIIINKDAQIDNGNCETERVTLGTQYWSYGQKEPMFDVQTTITCKEPPSLANLVHEFVHAFDLNYRVFGSPSQNLFSDNLNDLIVNGEPIRRITIGGDVIRDPRGFIAGSKSQENSWTPSSIEEFADTQMNAILDGSGVDNIHGFKNDEFGNARREEWNVLMNQWQQDMQTHFDAFLK